MKFLNYLNEDVDMPKELIGTIKGWKYALGIEPNDTIFPGKYGLPSEDDNYLYHATFEDYLQGIRTHGLIPTKNQTFKGYSSGKSVSVAPNVGEVAYWSSMGLWSRYDDTKRVFKPIILRFPKNEVEAKELDRSELLAKHIDCKHIEMWTGSTWNKI